VQKHETYTPTSVFFMMGQFLTLSTVSALIGVSFGFLTGLVTKHCRFLTRNAVPETLALILFAFMSYYVADMFKYSGIISIIVTAVMQAQYSWYNLSKQGKESSALTVQSLGYFSEALIFCYIGIGIFQ